MITPADIAACQDDQLSAMWDRCTIRNPDGWEGEVKVEGAIAWQWNGEDQIPCRIAVDNTQPRTVVIGGEAVMVTHLIVTLPVSIFPVENQIITVTSSVTDPSLAGAEFDVLAADPATFATARRVRCIRHV